MTSNLLIPPTASILDRACDVLASAYRLQDDAGAGQLERLIAKLPDASLSWALGVLHVHSPSGGVYQVTRGGCDCPNGRLCGKRQCWHIAAYELLGDMLETEAVTADNDAEDRYNRGGW